MNKLLPTLLILIFPIFTFAGVRIGSKNFTENYILEEIIAQLLESEGYEVNRNPGMGGTGIIYQALVNGEIDLYPEYTGTISHSILSNQKVESEKEIRESLLQKGILMSRSLGFNNGYALATNQETYSLLKLKSISDLGSHKKLNSGFSFGFMERADGIRALKRFYNLEFDNIKGMSHPLATQALLENKIQVSDFYTTDALLKNNKFHLLEDDLGFFPKYEAVILAKKEFVEKNPEVWMLIQRLEGQISEKEMRSLNALVEIEGQSIEFAAAKLASEKFEIKDTKVSESGDLFKLTIEHFYLVFSSLLAAILIGIPLGYLGTRSVILGNLILIFSSLIQTIPTLALLCFMIPVFGIGVKPTLIALFLYGLLPIVRNTFTGIRSVDSSYLNHASILGMNWFEKARWVEFPMAMSTILAGIKTTAVINVGMATIAAFIGAGGYGTLIVSGLALNNQSIILNGAIPSAIMALIIFVIFEISEKRICRN